jgi:hypothetical protein
MRPWNKKWAHGKRGFRCGVQIGMVSGRLLERTYKTKFLGSNDSIHMTINGRSQQIGRDERRSGFED